MGQTVIPVSPIRLTMAVWRWPAPQASTIYARCTMNAAVSESGKSLHLLKFGIVEGQR